MTTARGAVTSVRGAATTEVLFVLLPDSAGVDRLLTDLPNAGGSAVAVRRYPNANNPAELLSRVRAGRDPLATRRLRGMVASVALGAAVGAVVAGVLAGAFDLLGGLVGLAVAFGLLLGAFLGGFTAAMAGTESPRDEVRRLAARFAPGHVLVTFATADPALAAALRDRCEAAGYAYERRG